MNPKRQPLLSLCLTASLCGAVQAQDHPWRTSSSPDATTATLQQTRSLAGVFDAQGKPIPHTIHCKVQEMGGVVTVQQTETNKLIPGIPMVSGNQLVSGQLVFEYSRATGETVTNSYGETQPAAFRLRVSGTGLQAAQFLRRQQDSTWGNFLAGEVIAERNSFCMNQLKNMNTQAAPWVTFLVFFRQFQWAVY